MKLLLVLPPLGLGSGNISVCVLSCLTRCEPTRLFCPWSFLGKDSGMGYHFLLWGIFLTQGSNVYLLHPLHWQVDFSPLCHQRNPQNIKNMISFEFGMTNTVWKWASKVALVVKNLLAGAGDARDACSIPGLERSPGEGNGNLLQYSCLGESHGQKSLAGYNHGITKSRTRLSTQTTAPSFRLTEGQDLG